MKRLRVIRAQHGTAAYPPACLRTNRPPIRLPPNRINRCHKPSAFSKRLHSQQYNQSPQATANRLVQLASRVKNVNDATAVVIGQMGGRRN